MTKRTMTLNLTDAEMTVLEELCEKKDLSKTAVLRQALRLYQMVDERVERGDKLFFEDEAKKSKAEVMGSMTDVPLQIQRRSDGEWVEAQLLEGMKPPDLLVVEGEWAAERSQVMQALLQKGVPRQNWPQSLHWDWRKKAPQLKLLASTGYGLVSEKQWQGVMLTLTEPYAAQLNQDKGKPLVYIDYLEVAPWNWAIPEIGRDRRFRGIGSILFWKAVHQSREEGFHGRVGLHALPQAESFYEQVCRMTPLGQDPSKQNLRYFELSRIEAERHLKEERQS